jgi:hypothetical protein
MGMENNFFWVESSNFTPETLQIPGKLKKHPELLWFGEIVHLMAALRWDDTLSGVYD